MEKKRRRTEETTATSRRRKKELNFVTFHVADNFYDVLYDGVTGAFPEVNAPEFAYSLSFTSLARSLCLCICIPVLRARTCLCLNLFLCEPSTYVLTCATSNNSSAPTARPT